MDPVRAHKRRPQLIPLPEPTPRLMFLIPALNEEGRVGGIVRELQGRFPDAQVVVVDDGSTD
ncbi:MAG: hypothetical protein QGH45_15020, partial [Myxococcota bacterium]|nr:hypothetical protein [Myxococcota bacterium]